MKLIFIILGLVISAIVSLVHIGKKDNADVNVYQKEELYNNENTDPIVQFGIPTAKDATRFNIDSIPVFSGDQYVVINNNIPYFSSSEITVFPYEYYGELDELGRCSVTHACLGKETMPVKRRQEIGMIKPTGWHNKKYDCIEDGKFLYNRSHLIGHQLSAEDANRQNLITGTRFFNVQGMLPFEHMIADYIDETHNHVMYRVDPVYRNTELIARGVLLEAWSVEDNGAGICCNIFAYNAQPEIDIDYQTGDSHLVNENTRLNCDDFLEMEYNHDYILNTNSMKFHRCTCKYAQGTNHRNKKNFHGSREALINRRYTPCGYCKP